MIGSIKDKIENLIQESQTELSFLKINHQLTQIYHFIMKILNLLIVDPGIKTSCFTNTRFHIIIAPRLREEK